MLELCRVTPENFDECVALKVGSAQRDFVASNLESLAQAYVFPEAEARAVRLGERLVGFVLFHPADQAWEIARFMIGEPYQGRGLGRRALAVALEWIRREHGVVPVRLSVEPGNDRAMRFYRAAGFAVNGEVHEGEIVLVRATP